MKLLKGIFVIPLLKWCVKAGSKPPKAFCCEMSANNAVFHSWLWSSAERKHFWDNEEKPYKTFISL